jgi:hypothetical protein
MRKPSPFSRAVFARVVQIGAVRLLPGDGGERLSLLPLTASSAKRKREAERRKAPCPSSASPQTSSRSLRKPICFVRLRSQRRPPAFRRSTTALSSGKSFHPQGAARAMFRGPSAERGGRPARQPSSHFQRSTSRTGHSAGRRDARTAREQAVSSCPQAPHPLRLKEYLRERRPKRTGWPTLPYR